MNIISYDQNTFKEKYNAEFITGFTPGKLSKGDIDENQAKEYIKKLNHCASSETGNITFEAQYLAPSLEKGACSVVTLRIAQKAVEIFSRSMDFKTCTEQIKRAIEEANAIATKEKGAKVKEDRMKIRTLQAAFNTLTVNSTEDYKDFSLQKVKALASFFDLNINSSSKEVDIQPTTSCETKLAANLDNISAGVYLVRTLRLGDTDEAKRKREMWGHSTLYIKWSPKEELYFDLNLGLYELNKTPESRQILFQSQCAAQVKFQLEKCRFYKLETHDAVVA